MGIEFIEPTKMGKFFSLEQYLTEDGKYKLGTTLSLVLWYETDDGEKILEVKLPYAMVKQIKERYIPDFEEFRKKLKKIPEIQKDLDEEEKLFVPNHEIKGYG